MKQDRPIFIVGCPRSGTTLMRDLLRSHPNISIPGESHFIPPFYKAYGDPHTDAEAEKLAASILKLQWVRFWELPIIPSAFSAYRTYAEVISHLYGAFACKEQKGRWGDKTPEYVTELPLLARLFPQAQFIHVIRDGRDVALSWQRVNFGPENLFSAAHTWRHLVMAGIEAGRALGPKRYIEVFYGTLSQRPEESMRRVCAFVDEPFCSEVLLPSRRQWHVRRPLFGKRQDQPVAEREIVREQSGNWKAKMTLAQKCLFESIAGDTLAELGYEAHGIRRAVPQWERYFWEVHNTLKGYCSRLDDRDVIASQMTQFHLLKANVIGYLKGRK